MDNKAQASLEYMTIVTLLIILAAFVAFVATNLFTTKQGLQGTIEHFRERTLNMFGGA